MRTAMFLRIAIYHQIARTAGKHRISAIAWYRLTAATLLATALAAGWVTTI